MPEYIAARIRRAVPDGCSVIANSTPVISFGNAESAWVATLGLNPSLREFADAKDNWLTGAQRRLSTLDSLQIPDLADASDDHVAQVVSDCYGYFQTNPYHWFKDLENLMAAGVGASFYDGTACHLDLVQWATDPVWSNLSPAVRKQLIDEDREFLRQQLRNEKIRLVLLNGLTVINQIADMGVTLTDRGQAVSASKSCRIVTGTDGDTVFIGWSANLQSGFGMSNTFKDAIAQRVSEEVTGLGLTTITPATSHLPQGVIADSKTELVKVLDYWLANSRAATIGDVGRFGGRAWATIQIGGRRIVLNADTKRSAVEAYLAHAHRLGAEATWHVIANKKGTINKVVYTIDAATPGWYCYTATQSNSPEAF